MLPELIATRNLKLRPFGLDDAAAVYEYWKSDPGWNKFNESVPDSFSEHDAKNFVEVMCSRDRSSKPNWALLHEGNVVGVVSLAFDEDHKSVRLGYGIHSKMRGQGLIVETVEEVLKLSFDGYPSLEVVNALTARENVASIRVLEKLGFSLNTFEKDCVYSFYRSDLLA